MSIEDFNKQTTIGELSAERKAKTGDAVIGKELSTAALSGLMTVDGSGKSYDNSVLTADGPAPLSDTEVIDYPLADNRDLGVTEKTGEFDPSSLKPGEIGYVDPNNDLRKPAPEVLQ